MKLLEMNEDELRALAKKRFKNGRLTNRHWKHNVNCGYVMTAPLLGIAMILATGKIS